VARVEELLATFVLNALWQVPMLALLAAAAGRVLGRAPARYRHLVFSAALVLAAASPLRSTLLPRQQAQRAAASAPARAERATANAADRAVRPWTTSAATLAVPPAWLPWVAGLHAAFLLSRAARLARALVRTAQLAARTSHARCPERLMRAGEECRRAIGGGTARLSASEDVVSPMTLGIRRARIVLPAAFVAEASDADLRGALTHEMAHVARRDYLANLLSEAVFLPVAFHPAAGYLHRRVAESREMACDEAAAVVVGVRAYAATLLRLARSACTPPRAVHALGALDGGFLEERMKQLVSHASSMRPASAGRICLVSLVALTAAGVAASAAALRFEGPRDLATMIGDWKATMPDDSSAAGKPGAELSVKAATGAPQVMLVLYRYQPGPDGAVQGPAERPTVRQAAVRDGVLHFRTVHEDYQSQPGGAREKVEVDWEFRLVHRDEATIQPVRNSKLEAEKASGKDVPAGPPPLKMIRAR
jgi:beta-lactamase regulating signal transducer with metallopeptidase domain